MTAWLSEKDKEDLITSVESQFGSGVKGPDAVLKTKMELEAVEAALRAASASERNAKYILRRRFLQRLPPLCPSSL